MKYRVELPPDGERLLEVDLPPLRPGEPAEATVGGRKVEVLLLPEVEGEAVLCVDGRRYPLRELGQPERASDGFWVRFLHRGWPVRARVESEVDRLRQRTAAAGGPGGPFSVESPLPGVVRRVLAAEGQEVEADTPLFTLEAMKMENEVRAGRPGRVAAVLVSPGQVVNAGEPLARIDPL